MSLNALVFAASLAAAPAAPAPAAAAPAMTDHDHMMVTEADKAIAGDDPVFKKVNLKVESPKEGEVVPGPDLEIKFDLKGYELPGAQPGPHIHVIVDNQPYVPCYDASKPFMVKGLAEGSHTLRVFPSRPWHESIKAPGAFKTVHFFVGKKPEKKPYANWEDTGKPLLTYSRPKGNYAGEDAKKVMVDFWLTNATLGKSGGPMVKLVVDDQAPQLLQAWKPTYLEGLADGEHKITLDLVDAKGKPVDNAFNHTERTFTINAAPAAPAPAPDATKPPEKAAPSPGIGAPPPEKK